MSRLSVGIDAYPNGWVAVALDENRTFHEGFVAGQLSDLVGILLQEADEIVASIDIPIGPGGPDRVAEGLARQIVDNPSTVFPVPHECIWDCPDFASANAAHKLAHGKGLTQQVWGLKKKIVETARVVNDLPESITMFEGHPEVSFAAMKKPGHASLMSKILRGGCMQREKLLEQQGIVLPYDEPQPYDRAPANDINDACALAWTASRVLAGTAVALPALAEGIVPGRVSSDTIWY